MKVYIPCFAIYLSKQFQLTILDFYLFLNQTLKPDVADVKKIHKRIIPALKK